MRKSQIFLLTAIIAATPMAFANDPAAGGQEKAGMQSFAQLDKDQDGQLTQTELPASTMHSQHFAKIDADGNGSLSKMEVENHLIEDMGMTSEEVKAMDHHAMEGMDHGDMENMDHSDMDMDDNN